MSLLESPTQPVVLSRVYVFALVSGVGEDAYYYRVVAGTEHPGIFATREEAESYKALCASNPRHSIHEQLFLASLVVAMGSPESNAGLPQNSSIDTVEIHAWPAIGSSLSPGFPCRLIQAYDRGELTSRELAAADCDQLAAWATLDNIRNEPKSMRRRAWCQFAAILLNQSAVQEGRPGPPLTTNDVSRGYRTEASPLLVAHKNMRAAALELADIMRNSPMISEV